MPSQRGIDAHKSVGYFSWYLMIFISLKLIVLKNKSKIFNFAVFSFCLFVTEPYYGVVPYLF